MHLISKIFQFLFIFFIKIYQIILSPILGKNCRFNPTCSNYCKDAILVYGLKNGLTLSIRRISKCHPWGEMGEDPLP